MEADEKGSSKKTSQVKQAAKLIKVKKDWVHMDTTEPDKMMWIGDLPPPPKPGNTKVQ